MGKYWENEGYYSQPTEAELRQKMTATREQACRKGTALEPVVIEGRRIAKSWWGAAWCTNLGRYADYGSRLQRGQRYVRTGCVVDLKIEQGKIHAKVQGTRRKPYQVEIAISPLPEKKCQSIIEKCGQKLSTLEELTAGRFPKEMGELFQGRDGLFPTPREISFDCSCPDWAQMCKHVAAVLYGVGARLDDDPALFFELRGIDMGRFIDATLDNRVERMLSNAQKSSSRILKEEDLSTLFGVL